MPKRPVKPADRTASPRFRQRKRGKAMQGSLRDFSRQPLTDAEQDALWATVSNAEPIATAILGVAMVEHELERLLQRRFPRNDEKTWKLLVAESGPLGSLHTKILAGYAFRIYDNDVKHNLEIIQEIRNGFAHSKRLLSYDHDLIITRLRTVRIAKGFTKRWHPYLMDITSGKADGKTAYVNICLILTHYLLKAQTRAAQTSARKAERRARATLAKSPYLGLFAALAVPHELPPIGSLGSILGHQNGDPKSPAQLQSLSRASGPRAMEERQQGQMNAASPCALFAFAMRGIFYNPRFAQSSA